MTLKEIEMIQKKALLTAEFSPNTKSSIVSSDMNKLAQKIKQSISKKKTVIAIVIDQSELK